MRAASLLLASKAKAPTEAEVEVMVAALAAPAPTGVPQLSLVATATLVESKTVRTGSARTPVTPKVASLGPTARTRTGLMAPGPMTKPAVNTAAPAPVWARVEILERRGS